jgi:hypothetical protein
MHERAGKGKVNEEWRSDLPGGLEGYVMEMGRSENTAYVLGTTTLHFDPGRRIDFVKGCEGTYAGRHSHREYWFPVRQSSEEDLPSGGIEMSGKMEWPFGMDTIVHKENGLEGLMVHTDHSHQKPYLRPGIYSGELHLMGWVRGGMHLRFEKPVRVVQLGARYGDGGVVEMLVDILPGGDTTMFGVTS